MLVRRSTTRRRADVWDGDAVRARSDVLATEEPLEIRVQAGLAASAVAVTMRTPGDDFELAAGFLLAEGLVSSASDVRRIAYCDDVEEQHYNVVTVHVDAAAHDRVAALQRRVVTTSACGVCGTASLDALADRGCAVTSDLRVPRSVLAGLPDRLRERQSLFAATGGTHAAGLFTAEGELVALREDVGRHNAVDKLLGWALLEGRLPLSEHMLVVSGRSSYEIVQKAASAGLPIVCSVSAPSSLAVATAERFGMALVGFLRGPSATVYTGGARFAAR